MFGREHNNFHNIAVNTDISYWATLKELFN